MKNPPRPEWKLGAIGLDLGRGWELGLYILALKLLGGGEGRKSDKNDASLTMMKKMTNFRS